MKTLKYLFFLLFFYSSFRSMAQDVILKKDGTEIEAKILEVNTSEVKYKRFDYLSGPTITISKSTVFYIKYQNGNKEVFSKEEKTNSESKTVVQSTVVNVEAPVKKLNVPCVILKRNGEEIKVVLVEIGETTINYYPADKGKETAINLHQSAIFYLKYEDGKKEMFTAKDPLDVYSQNDRDQNGIRRFVQPLPRRPNSVNKTKKESVVIEDHYDAEGYLHKQVIYNDDKTRKIEKSYYSNGVLEYENHYFNAQKHGISRHYSKDGILTNETSYEYDESSAFKDYNMAGILILETPGLNDGYYRMFYPSGILKQESHLTNLRANGTFKVFRENGKLQYEQDYVNNVQKGPTRWYSEDGSPTTSAPGEVNPASVYYDETGKETTAIPVSGIHKAYYKTGELCVETPYENGKINGLRRIYYKNQKVSFQIPYIDNKINGVVFYFDSNSVLLAEKFYLDSLQHGSSKSYFTNGNVQTEEKYVNGKKNGTVVNYTEDGKVWIATQYKDDKKNGVQKMFYPNGNLQSEHEFKDDVGNGKFKVYDDKGVLLSESAEIDGLTNGEAKYYHNGALFMTSSFINGKKEGVEKIYQANGALLLETPYSAGKKNGIQTYYNNGTAFTKIKYVNNAKDVAFEKEQEKIRKKEIRQAALNEFGVTLVQGLQQTSAQLDYQRNPNSQTLSNYLNVVANNSMKDGKEAIKDNNTVLNGASANYGNSESYAATNSGNSQTAAVCSKNAKLAWEESDEYRDYVQKNPSCNKKAYIAQRKQAELLLEHCKCCSTNEDINVLNSTISTLTKRINDMPDCNFQFADPGPPKQQNYEVVPMSPPSKGDNGGKATKAK